MFVLSKDQVELFDLAQHDHILKILSSRLQNDYPDYDSHENASKQAISFGLYEECSDIDLLYRVVCLSFEAYRFDHMHFNQKIIYNILSNKEYSLEARLSMLEKQLFLRLNK